VAAVLLVCRILSRHGIHIGCADAYPQVTDVDVINKESLRFSFIEPPDNTDV
jgi:hypothetical protein